MLLKRACAGAIVVLACACSLTSGSDERFSGGDLHCADGTKPCGRSCVAVDQPSTGCGDASCEACSLEHASAGCAEGQCAIAACEAGWFDCDASPANGCEEFESDCNCHSVVLATNAASARFAPKGMDFGSGDWTWEAWVKSGGSANGWRLGLRQGGEYGLLHVDIGPHASVACGLTSEGTPFGHNYVVEHQALEPAKWQHVACQRRGEQLSLYVDGDLRVTGTIDRTATTPMEGFIGYAGPALDFKLQMMGPMRISRVARYDSNFSPRRRWLDDPDTVLLYLVKQAMWGNGINDEAGGDNAGVVLGGIVSGGGDTPCGTMLP